MSSKIEKLHAIIGDPASSENEKEIARRILDEYAAQGIDVSVGEKMEFFRFKVKSEFEFTFLMQLLWNVLWNVLGDDAKGRDYRDYRRIRRKYVDLQLTKSEFIEMDQKYFFYLRDFDKQKEILYSAWIQRNHLYSTATDQRPEREKTMEELERQRQEAEMYGAIRKAEFNKSLNPGR